MANLPFGGAKFDNKKTRYLRRLLNEVLTLFTRHSQLFATYHERPKQAEMFGTWPDNKTFSNVAIVMQGPIYEDYDFTAETLKLYQKLFPGVNLILSTWKDTPSEHINLVKALGVSTVLSDKPHDPGHSNVNMQVVSTAAGVNHASSIDGVDWIMKTRTDQRLNNPNVLSYLIATAKSFPVAKGFDQEYRIVGVGHGSLKYVPYHVTDQTIFGSANDMIKYWSTPLRPKSSFKATDKDLMGLYVSLPIKKMSDGISAEPYITSEFLKSIGRRLDWTLKDSWEAYRDHFCFLNQSSTDFYWVKNQSATKEEIIIRYDAISNRKEMTFDEWLLLYSGELPTENANRFQKNLESPYNTEIIDFSDKK